jgi:hypothetical protein
MKYICNGYAFAALLSGLWVWGEVFSVTLDGAIHLLLATAVIVALIKSSSDRKRTVRSEQQARSRKRGRDLGAQKTWHLK